MFFEKSCQIIWIEIDVYKRQVVSREDGSGTRGAFVELFGIEEEKDGEKVDMTTDEASVTNSTSVMMTTVAGDENAIGYISLGSLDDTVKAVTVSYTHLDIWEIGQTCSRIMEIEEETKSSQKTS